MLHVSTRGEAPAISFTDALLAGLARDGGLYVPERWPALSRESCWRAAPRRRPASRSSALAGGLGFYAPGIQAKNLSGIRA